jgi:NAD-dependent deacetylase
VIPAALIKHLQSASRVVILTGAGVSAESGVPAFRDAQTGLWVQYRPEDLATPEAFLRHPQLVWEWYAWRKMLIAEVHAILSSPWALPRLSTRQPRCLGWRWSEGLWWSR